MIIKNKVNIFNTEKTVDDYVAGQPLFFGKKPALFDSIHKPYPRIWELYKIMQSLTWDANEFDYSVCNLEFKTVPKGISDMMIKTLSWQWENDSVASRSIISVLAPFVTDTSLWAAISSINTSEQIHSETYSEIVRLSFDDPTTALSEILSVKESLNRMDSVSKVFDKMYEVSSLYTAGKITKDEAYPHVLLTIVALYLLERVQFMASFAITFTICSGNMFQPIGKAVQKIAQDEIEVHAELDREIIRIERSTEYGKKVYDSIKDQVKQLCDDVIKTEMNWTDYLFSDGRSLVGADAESIKKFVLYNAKSVYKFLDIDSDYVFPTKNPMPRIDDWIDISKTQAAPQEQDNNAYKVNTFVRNDSDETFDIDF